MEQITVGTRVRLARDVERYPHFIAHAGLTGTVVDVDARRISVRMDAYLDGADEWHNEVRWYADPVAQLDDFAGDVEVLP